MPLITLNLSHSNDILNDVHLEKDTVQLHMAKIHMNSHPIATEVSITLLKTKHMARFYLQISKASAEIINPPISPNNAIKPAEHAGIPVMAHGLHKHHCEACSDHVLPTIHTPSPSIFPNSSPSSHPTIPASSLLPVLIQLIILSSPASHIPALRLWNNLLKFSVPPLHRSPHSPTIICLKTLDHLKLSMPHLFKNSCPAIHSSAFQSVSP